MGDEVTRLLVEPVKRRSETTELPVLTISAKHGFVSQKERFSQVIAGDSLPKYTHLRKDELSYNRGNSKTFPFGCVFKLRVKSALIPNVYKSFRCIQADPDFLEQFFANGGLNKQLSRVITSGARSNGLLNISDSSFYSCKVSTPTPTEQERIGVFLVELDRKVSSLSNQIEKAQDSSLAKRI